MATPLWICFLKTPDEARLVQEKELHLGVIQARTTTHSVIAWTDEQGVVEIETRARHGMMTPLSVGQSLCFFEEFAASHRGETTNCYTWEVRQWGSVGETMSWKTKAM